VTGRSSPLRRGPGRAAPPCGVRRRNARPSGLPLRRTWRPRSDRLRRSNRPVVPRGRRRSSGAGPGRLAVSRSIRATSAGSPILRAASSASDTCSRAIPKGSGRPAATCQPGALVQGVRDPGRGSQAPVEDEGVPEVTLGLVPAPHDRRQRAERAIGGAVARDRGAEHDVLAFEGEQLLVPPTLSFRARARALPAPPAACAGPDRRGRPRGQPQAAQAAAHPPSADASGGRFASKPRVDRGSTALRERLRRQVSDRLGRRPS